MWSCLFHDPLLTVVVNNLIETTTISLIIHCLIQGDTKKRELLKNPTKIEEIQEKKFIDRN